ncbi:EamA family transporter [Flagellimonas sp.]|uniref:EamA family transporter n=1 Tax=Flagellimonas sp. TaxID=2058762 RepID=UPI003BB0488E
MRKIKPWLLYAILATIFWGVWGAFASLPSTNGFPDTLNYCVWALTMIIPSVYVLKLNHWKLQMDKKSIYMGMIIGILGAGGQMVLFYTVTIGPTYLIFPIISLSPVITIVLSLLFLRERVRILGAIGIALALMALPLFEYSNDIENSNSENGVLWFALTIVILVAWGVQAYFMKLANQTMAAESIFFYMMISGLLLIPIALFLTDFDYEINWGLNGPYLAFIIQIMNSIGALCLVYAFRYGKAIVVSPMANAGAPLMTSIISMILLGIIPGQYKILGIIFAIVAAFLLAIEPEEKE